MFHSLQAVIKRFEKSITILSGSIILTAILFNFNFHYLEANLYDLRISNGIDTPVDPNIVLITLDDKSTKELDDFAPLPFKFHINLLSALTRLNPKAVGYLIDLNHVHQITPEIGRQKQENDFVQLTQNMEKNGTHFLLGTPFGVNGEVIPPFPLSTLAHAISVIHKDGNVFSEDKITRRALLTLYGKPSFHLQLARDLKYLGPSEPIPGAFSVPEVDGEYFFFRYHGDTKLQRNIQKFKYPRYSFSDILQNRIPDQAFRGKIVLIGTLSKDDSSDFAFTPYSRAPFTNPKITVHANILDSIINKDTILIAQPFLNSLITIIATTTVLWWIMTSTPLYGVFATLALALTIVGISQVLYQFKGLWIKESQPLLGIFVSYYLAVPYRLIKEYKKRWDYQRKNEMLTQVEEMKTNFISLVTHDLKTPVAKIQGLTEVLLTLTRGHLNESERSTLEHIVAATDELNHFISSILELSKIESNHIHFHFESKDINLLIEKSIARHKEQAKEKQIKIDHRLDPIFPIKIDANLIYKVLNNLIDNAIKYSLPNSRIKIESKEENDWVVIQIADSGIGMTTEEQRNLFTRFYRAKNDTTAIIAGTGLGLYLTKYFIEAHQGHVEVQSYKGKGSTVSIFLPIVGPISSSVIQMGLKRQFFSPRLPIQFKESHHV